MVSVSFSLFLLSQSKERNLNSEGVSCIFLFNKENRCKSEFIEFIYYMNKGSDHLKHICQLKLNREGIFQLRKSTLTSNFSQEVTL